MYIMVHIIYTLKCSDLSDITEHQCTSHWDKYCLCWRESSLRVKPRQNWQDEIAERRVLCDKVTNGISVCMLTKTNKIQFIIKSKHSLYFCCFWSYFIYHVCSLYEK